jgi:hypothetical protein
VEHLADFLPAAAEVLEVYVPLQVLQLAQDRQ